jgi:tellurite resistance protein TerC
MPWILFNLFVLAMLAIDLGVFHKKTHEVKIKEALIWSAVWISLAMLFNVGIYLWQGSKPAMEFLTGYIIEKSLSVDNIFVFIMIFSFFSVPPLYQHKVLFWGILGALLMRATLIVTGAALLERFHWIIYVFGGFLAFTGIKMLFAKETPFDPDKNPAVRLFKRFLPVTSQYHGDQFFVRKEGRLWSTPLFLVLFIVEATDLIFAVDSIPAIFAVTTDPFIVYTSNVFAILGLRSLYFALAGVMDKFRYLKVGLAFVLMFVGAKMLIMGWIKIPVAISLGMVTGILALSIFASLYVSRTVIDKK